MGWTTQQQKVIDLHNRSLLVSAAAGSGKTAVLVERILGIVLDPENPVDIDRLLIVTFTNAAAQEMRTRLYNALMERAEKEPQNRHLRRQLQLVFQAQVSTIDSFCLYILRNFPEAVDMDPAFRLIDSGEQKLLESDVMEQLFEEKYEEADDRFVRFLEGFSAGKTDEEAASLVLDLYHYSRSHPWPDEWLSECLEKLRIDTPEALYDSDWCSWYLRQARLRIGEFIEDYRKIQVLSNRPDVPETFAEAYGRDIEKLEGALVFDGWEEASRKIGSISLEKQPPLRKKGYDEALQNQIKGKRAALKKKIDDFTEDFGLSADTVLAEILESGESVKELVALVRRYAELYSAEKKKKGIADFPDLEHMALSVLYDENGERTDAARELSARFEEIMIDEYQDSNRVQEALLTAVSRIPDGRNNLFMVGDMKQSIYRFRMADPGLFTEKYGRYSREDSDEQLIELSKNFRSRKEVTRTANWFFFQMMQESVGGISYDRNSALYTGASYPDADPRDAYRTELLIAETDSAPADCSKQEAEAAMIAAKIREMVSCGFPVKGAGGTLRPLEYRDIVILLRTAYGWDQVFQQVLEEQGIPVYVESRSGYFDAPEVHLTLNILSVIDNPMNDLPLAAVLHSAVFGFTAEELAEIRADYPLKEHGNGLYGALMAYGADDALKRKIDGFLRQIDAWREASASLPLSMLLRQIYRDTGLVSYVGALPGGERRTANLGALIDKAADFEKTSYHGIFHFIRYVDKLKRYQADEGEQNTAGEKDNVVRIMTIHKSKGLEFPVVFLAGCAKQFNTSDSKKRIILHQDYGIAADLADPETRIRRKTFMRKVFAEKNKIEGLGEELRVLYVGMTRAKEKLILTGTAENADAVLEKYQERWTEPAGRLSYGDIAEAKSYLDWILPSFRTNGPVTLEFAAAGDLFEAKRKTEEIQAVNRETLLRMIENAPDPDGTYAKAFDEHFGFCYDDALSRVFATVSVSKLKAAQAASCEETETVSLVDDVPEEETPEKLSAGAERKPAGITGSERGTLYHRVMEKCDPHRPAEAQLLSWKEAGVLTEEERRAVNPAKIDAFFASDPGQRFIRAYDAGKGFRERQFIIGLPAAEIYPELSGKPEGEETVMLQGVVDLYFEEDDGLVIVDYKTDSVRTKETLIERYRIQLELYARALSQATGKNVKEMWIWSFKLGEEICL